ncbi:MAG: efflux RND transporter periplasmic adaptor subunit [Sphingomonas sp.]|uniref:efflux RND transporter periplasmic adaptor subunit n=1 Tax=Sphingomonas sp. TaxID=28214 RepID=UPI0025F8769D|nr:efflux RND transporter periplasmic adaptor subunit [Sphingomonas sp.]MBX9881427.1 efflux RND transporter periplasmic adaptor subunit [Sphingomonas sp.]
MNYEPGRLMDAQLLTDQVPAKRSRAMWYILAVAAVAAVALLWWYASHSRPVDAPTAPQAPSVTVIVPGRQQVAREVTATGTLAARVDMPVGVVGEGGLVDAVLVQPGDWVRAGQVLATIDRSVQVQTQAQLAASISVAQADARLAQSELDRAQTLVARGFISKADLDRRTATRDAALARVKVAEAQLGETRARTARLAIRAPAAGLVLTRAVEPGQVVGPASGTLFRLAKGGELELRAALAEGDLAQLKVGATAEVTPVGATRSFAGRIWQVSPVIDPQSRLGTARIALGYDPMLRPGGFAGASIVAGDASAPLLPQSAVQSDDKGNYVYVVGAGNKVERRAIKIGVVSDAGVAITQGLAGDERVVASAGAFLNPGQKVIPVAAKPAR